MTATPDNSGPPAAATERFRTALSALERAPEFSKIQHVARVLDSARRLLREDGGAAAVFEDIARVETGGLFLGTDWAHPERLLPALTPWTLASEDGGLVALELLSDLRLLAVAEGSLTIPGIGAEAARDHLTQVLALNLDYVFRRETEASRHRQATFLAISNALVFVAEAVGMDLLLAKLVGEVWRLLRQRPVRIDRIRHMIAQLRVVYANPDSNHRVVAGAESLISALSGPTPSCRADPGTEAYEGLLATMDLSSLQQEASTFARTMHDTGLVSEYHATFLRHLHAHHQELVPQALGLSSTGIDGYLSYRSLVLELIDRAVFPETCRSVYRLACLLERGGLYNPAIAPSLWRQAKLRLHEDTRREIAAAFGEERSPEVFLLAGVICVLGLPLGIGQGNNPTCQSARAISLWAYSDPDYLLQLVVWAARDREIVMHFEGEAISSKNLPAGIAKVVDPDLDALSLVLVPHLDRIYAEMGRLAFEPGKDPHERVNPEFHGWRVARGFGIAVDVTTGLLDHYPEFIRSFYGHYHPFYNGGRPVVHPQPAGIAVTDSSARFIGWHAITVLRCALDQSGIMRVYFYNPNNDSGQDWGNGVEVSTEGAGEFHGESSLPFDQFTSRLYLFHFDPFEQGEPQNVPAEEVERVIAWGTGSWAANKTGNAPADVASDGVS